MADSHRLSAIFLPENTTGEPFRPENPLYLVEVEFMEQTNSIVCRATAVGFAETSSAEVLVESNGVRKSFLVKSRADFSVSLGDRIFCLMGCVQIGVPTKPNVNLCTLSSPQIDQLMFQQCSQKIQVNEMVIEERIFKVLKILSA